MHPSRAFVDDALHPMVLSDDHFVLDQHRRIHHDYSIRGYQVVFAKKEFANVRI